MEELAATASLVLETSIEPGRMLVDGPDCEGTDPSMEVENGAKLVYLLDAWLSGLVDPGAETDLYGVILRTFNHGK